MQFFPLGSCHSEKAHKAYITGLSPENISTNMCKWLFHIFVYVFVHSLTHAHSLTYSYPLIWDVASSRMTLVFHSAMLDFQSYPESVYPVSQCTLWKSKSFPYTGKCCSRDGHVQSLYKVHRAWFCQLVWLYAAYERNLFLQLACWPTCETSCLYWKEAAYLPDIKKEKYLKRRPWVGRSSWTESDFLPLSFILFLGFGHSISVATIKHKLLSHLTH